MRPPSRAPHKLDVPCPPRQVLVAILVLAALSSSLLVTGCMVSRPMHDAAVAALNESRAEVSDLRAQQEQSQKSLEAEVRKANEATARTARTEASQLLRERLAPQVQAGRLEVRESRGRLVVDLAQDLLFPSKTDRLGDVGEETVIALAGALSLLPGWSFRIEVHADDADTTVLEGADSWTATATRAATLAQSLAASGVPPEQLSATGMGRFRPRADNRSEDGRTLNRRVEVIAEPSP